MANVLAIQPPMTLATWGAKRPPLLQKYNIFVVVILLQKIYLAFVLALETGNE
jgi:hypothetical protein